MTGEEGNPEDNGKDPGRRWPTMRVVADGMNDGEGVGNRPLASDLERFEFERFRDLCRRAGIGESKPLYGILLTVLEAAKRAESAVQERARGLTPEGERAIVDRVVIATESTMKNSVSGYRIQLDRKASLLCGGACAVALLAGSLIGWSVGWSSGQHSVQRTQEQIAAFQGGPEAAGLWLQLMQNNDPIKAVATCTGKAVTNDKEGRACMVPLWLERPVASDPVGFDQRKPASLEQKAGSKK